MTAPRIKWITRDDPPDAFPDVDAALSAPNGLLAAGGDLAAARLLHAYRQGIFPWFDGGQPILWWSPDPRCVLVPGEFHLARRLRRSLRQSTLDWSYNQAFERVIVACARRRRSDAGTWITPEMIAAYTDLHRLGWAHSLEVWRSNELVGGIYGLAIGRAFFGESMFSSIADTSKIALLALCRHLATREFPLLDCQVASPHLLNLGAKPIPRKQFVAMLQQVCSTGGRFDDWPAGRFPAAELGQT